MVIDSSVLIAVRLREPDADLRFGKGRQRTAGLTFGDCRSYALAGESGLPLLFKGGDFAATDIQPALSR